MWFWCNSGAERALRWSSGTPTYSNDTATIASLTLDQSNYGNQSCTESNRFGNDRTFVNFTEAGKEIQYFLEDSQYLEQFIHQWYLALNIFWRQMIDKDGIKN